MVELTPKQKSFIHEYLKDKNGTQAAIRAGYSVGSAKVQAARLLTKDNVKQELARLSDKIATRCEITVEYVLEGLKEVAERCMQRKPVMVRDGRHLVQKIDEETGEGVWEFDASGASRAFELLGKYKSMFSDKVDLTINESKLANKSTEEKVKDLLGD